MPEGSWQDSWRALEQLVASGQILAIGLLQILTWVHVDTAMLCRFDVTAVQKAHEAMHSSMSKPHIT